MNNKCYDVHLKDFARFYFLYVERSRISLTFSSLFIGKLEILKSLCEIKLFIMSQLSTHDSQEWLWSSRVESHLNSSDICFNFKLKRSLHIPFLTLPFNRNLLFVLFPYRAFEHWRVQLVEMKKKCKIINNSTFCEEILKQPASFQRRLIHSFL